MYPARAAACARSDGRAPRAAAARPQRAPNMNTRRRLGLAAVYGEIADHMQLRARSRSRSRRAAPRPAPEASPAAAAADLQTAAVAQAAPAANQSAAACVAAAAAATAVDQSVATVAPAAAGSTAATAAAVKWPRLRTLRPQILPAAAAAELQTAAVAVAAVAPQAAAAANQSAAACTAAAAAATAVDQSVATVALAAAGSTAATAAAVKWPRPRTLTRAAKLGKDDVVDTLLTSIGSGESSVAQVARLAAPLARRRGDGALLQLASFRERDLHRRCAKQPWRAALPQLYPFSMPKFTKESGWTATAAKVHYCILPHELFASVAAYSAELWQFLFGTAAELEAWWRSASERGGPWYTAAAAHVSGGRGRHAVPVGIHGDDAGGHANDKVTVVTWNSVAVSRSTLDSRLVFAMFKGREAPADAGLRSILKVLAWSLNALAEGTWPATDESGRPFDAAHHPARAQLAGRPLAPPAPAAAGQGGPPDHPGAAPAAAAAAAGPDDALAAAADAGVVKAIWCHAHNGRGDGRDPANLYTNFRRDAALRQTHVNPREWFEEAAAAEHPTPLLHVRHFSVDHVYFDIMHCMDLGVFQLAVPSALAELTGAVRGLQAASIFPGVDLNARLAAATVHYRAWCQERRLECRAPKFTTRWTQLPYPQVSQLQAKAAEMRSCLVPWMRDACAAAAAEHGDHGHVRAELFNAFVRVDEACRANGAPRFMAAAAAEKLEQNMEQALLLYNALAAEAAASDRCVWRLRPKLHACTHIGYDHGGTNPRRVHCYADEDMVGKMKRVYLRCHACTAPQRALQRYAILVGKRWAQQFGR